MQAVKQAASISSRWLGRKGRITAGLCASLLALTLTGCGDQASDADSIIFIDAADASWTLPDNWGGGSISPALPVPIQVHYANGNTTPVAGADITVLVGGIGITTAEVFDPVTGVQLSVGGVYQTVTDDHGLLIVDPAGSVPACPAIAAGGKDLTFSGNLSVAVYIARDANAWNADFTYTCKAP